MIDSKLKQIQIQIRIKIQIQILSCKKLDRCDTRGKIGGNLRMIDDKPCILSNIRHGKWKIGKVVETDWAFAQREL